MIASLLPALSPSHLVPAAFYVTLLPPSSPSSNPITELLVLFPQVQCSVPPLLENPVDSFCFIKSRLNPNTQDPSGFGLLPSHISILILSLYHIFLSYKCYVGSFIGPPSNVELAYPSHHWPPPTKSYPSFRLQFRCPSSAAEKHPLISLRQTFTSPFPDSIYYHFFLSLLI